MNIEDIDIPEGFYYVIHSHFRYVQVYNPETNVAAQETWKKDSGPTEALLKCVDRIQSICMLTTEQ